MKKYTYYSFTLGRWVRVYATIGETMVALMDENFKDFGLIQAHKWAQKMDQGYIKEGWEQ